MNLCLPSTRVNVSYFHLELNAGATYLAWAISESNRRNEQILKSKVLPYGYQLSKAGRKFVEKFSRSNFDVVTGNWLRF